MNHPEFNSYIAQYKGPPASTPAMPVEIQDKIINGILSPSAPIGYRELYQFCTQMIAKKRWIRFEEAALKSISETSFQVVNKHNTLISYASNIMQNRWKEIEQYIEDPNGVYDYASLILKARWREKEHIVLKGTKGTLNKDWSVATRYAHSLCAGRWLEYESVLINDNPDPAALANYARNIVRERWPAAEPFILKDIDASYFYARDVIGGRWPEAEPIIAQDPVFAKRYAEHVIHGAFKQAEPILLESEHYFDYFSFATRSNRDLATKLATQFDESMTVKQVLEIIQDGRNKSFENKLLNSTHAHRKAIWYAKEVLKARWPEAEIFLCKSAKYGVEYARDVIKGRWEQAEKEIAKKPNYLFQYAAQVIKGRLPEVLHNRMIAHSFVDAKYTKRYFQMLEKTDERQLSDTGA